MPLTPPQRTQYSQELAYFQDALAQLGYDETDGSFSYSPLEDMQFQEVAGTLVELTHEVQDALQNNHPLNPQYDQRLALFKEQRISVEAVLRRMIGPRSLPRVLLLKDRPPALFPVPSTPALTSGFKIPATAAEFNALVDQNAPGVVYVKTQEGRNKPFLVIPSQENRRLILLMTLDHNKCLCLNFMNYALDDSIYANKPFIQALVATGYQSDNRPRIISGLTWDEQSFEGKSMSQRERKKILAKNRRLALIGDFRVLAGHKPLVPSIFSASFWLPGLSGLFVFGDDTFEIRDNVVIQRDRHVQVINTFSYPFPSSTEELVALAPAALPSPIPSPQQSPIPLTPEGFDAYVAAHGEGVRIISGVPHVIIKSTGKGDQLLILTKDDQDNILWNVYDNVNTLFAYLIRYETETVGSGVSLDDEFPDTVVSLKGRSIVGRQYRTRPVVADRASLPAPVADELAEGRAVIINVALEYGSSLAGGKFFYTSDDRFVRFDPVRQTVVFGRVKGDRRKVVATFDLGNLSGSQLVVEDRPIPTAAAAPAGSAPVVSHDAGPVEPAKPVPPPVLSSLNVTVRRDAQLGATIRLVREPIAVDADFSAFPHLKTFEAFQNAVVREKKPLYAGGVIELKWGEEGTWHPYQISYSPPLPFPSPSRGEGLREGVYLLPVEGGGAPEGVLTFSIERKKNLKINFNPDSPLGIFINSQPTSWQAGRRVVSTHALKYKTNGDNTLRVTVVKEIDGSLKLEEVLLRGERVDLSGDIMPRASLIVDHSTEDYEEKIEFALDKKGQAVIVNQTFSKFIEQKKITLSAELSPVAETNNRSLQFEVSRTIDRRKNETTYRLMKMIKRGVETSFGPAGKEIKMGKTITVMGDTNDYWEEVDVLFTAEDKIEVVGERYFSTKGVEYVVCDEVFSLKARVVTNPLMGSYSLANATLEPTVDLSFFGSGDHLFNPKAKFKAPPLPIPLPKGARGGFEKVSLKFAHENLGEIIFSVSFDPERSSLTATRLPLDPRWSGHKLNSPTPSLESSPGENALVSFNLIPHISRGYQRDGTKGRRYLVAEDQIAGLINWTKLLGLPPPPTPSLEGRGEGERVALEVRFGATEGVTFHAASVNPDGSLKIEGLDLSGMEYDTLRRALDGLDRPGAVGPVDDELEVDWPRPEKGSLIDIIRGDIFVPTNESIERIVQFFSAKPSNVKAGDSLPEDLFEFESARSGIVLRFPAVFFGRIEENGKGRARSPIKFLEKAPIQYYYRGYEERITPLPDNYVLRDMGGFPQLYALGRTEDDESRIVHLASTRHEASDLFMAFGDIAVHLKADGDSRSIAEEKEKGQRGQKKLMRKELDERLSAVLKKEPLPAPQVYLAQKVFRKGEEIRLHFASGSKEGRITLYTLSGLSIDRSHQRLSFGELQLNRLPVEARFSSIDPGTIILTVNTTPSLNPSPLEGEGQGRGGVREVEVYQWDVYEGKLVRQIGKRETNIDPASVAELIRSKNIDLNLIRKMTLSQMDGLKVRSRAGASLIMFSGSKQFPLPVIPDQERGFTLLPAMVKTIRGEGSITKALSASHFHGAFFRPVEETLMAQLLVGRGEELMTFVSDEGAILQVRMEVDPTHLRERYVFSQVAHLQTVIKECRFLIPDPDRKGEYLQIDPSRFMVTSKRFSGEDRNVLEFSIRLDGVKTLRFEMREVATGETLKGLGAGHEGMTAFSFYGVMTAEEQERVDSTFRNRARASLRATVNFFNMHQGPETISVESAPLSLIQPTGQHGILLSNERVLDASLHEIEPGHFVLEGIRIGEDKMGYLFYEREVEGGRKKAGAFRVLAGAFGASYFQLQDVQTHEVFNMIVGKDGEIKLWRRRRHAEEFTASRVYASVEMHKIKGGTYASKVDSMVERRPGTRFVDGQEMEGLFLRGALGRSEGADEADLTMGILPKIPLFVYQDKSGELKIARGIIDEREVEKGDYYPFGYDALIVDGDEEIVEENGKFIVKIVEDNWKDSEGNTRRGKVRIFFRNKNAQGLDGNSVSPYGYLVFENRDCLLGEADLFKSAKVVAHYHEDPQHFYDRKLMPNDKGVVAKRAGVAAIDVNWNEIFALYDTPDQMLRQALSQFDGTFGTVSSLLGILHYISKSAEAVDDEATKFVTGDGNGRYHYSDPVLASLALYASSSPPGVVDLTETSKTERSSDGKNGPVSTRRSRAFRKTRGAIPVRSGPRSALVRPSLL